MHGIRPDCETYRQVDDQNGDVTQRRPSCTQIGERLVSGSVDDKQAGDLDLIILLGFVSTLSHAKKGYGLPC